ncbi:hypothetical protein BKA65DRAFT_471870 [Rhexocercosporidium sp. MPI-PUGE-AT-0058]|nr:hypothetical protein BKA65DRAFT_471870 [Rhexocercosporidium sp. MPI-PUGE-AT-0058]
MPLPMRIPQADDVLPPTPLAPRKLARAARYPKSSRNDREMGSGQSSAQSQGEIYLAPPEPVPHHHSEPVAPDPDATNLSIFEQDDSVLLNVPTEPPYLDSVSEMFFILDDTYHMDGIFDLSFPNPHDWPGIMVPDPSDSPDPPLGESLINRPIESGDCRLRPVTLSGPTIVERTTCTGIITSISDEAVQAYDATLGNWRPIPNGNLAMDRAALSITPSEQHRMRGSMGHFDPTVIHEAIPTCRRDEIVVIIADLFSKMRPPQAIPSFPSVEILDELLKIFLTSQKNQPVGFVHVPTFSPLYCDISLLMACITAGATFSPNLVAHKFGLAMIELSRFIPLLMMRHGHRFIASSYPHISPSPELTAEQLDETWKSWVDQESMKRTVFRNLTTCTQRAIVRDALPLISCLEISTPIPEQSELWSANSAAEWRSMHLRLQTAHEGRRLSLTDCLADVTAIQTISPLQDADFAKMAAAVSLLSMDVQDRRRNIVFAAHCDDSWSIQKVFGPSTAQHATSFVDEMRGLANSEGPRPGTTAATELVCEFHSFYNATPTFLIEALLGGERHVKAREALPRLEQWRQTRQARTAVWHAGQLFRIVRAIKPRERIDFQAFVLFHAALCIWAFGIMGRSSPNVKAKAQHEVDRSGGGKIRLDGVESLETQRWISRNQGFPYIPDSSDMIGMPNQDTILIPIYSDALLGNGFISPLLGALEQFFSLHITGRRYSLLHNACQVLKALARGPNRSS